MASLTPPGNCCGFPMSLCILYTTRFIRELLVSSWVPSTFRRTFGGRFLCVSPTVWRFPCFSLPSFFTQDVTLALTQLNQPALCDVDNTQLWLAPNPWRYPTPPAHSSPPVYIEFFPTSPSIDFTASSQMRFHMRFLTCYDPTVRSFRYSPSVILRKFWVDTISWVSFLFSH